MRDPHSPTSTGSPSRLTRKPPSVVMTIDDVTPAPSSRRASARAPHAPASWSIRSAPATSSSRRRPVVVRASARSARASPIGLPRSCHKPAGLLGERRRLARSEVGAEQQRLGQRRAVVTLPGEGGCLRRPVGCGGDVVGVEGDVAGGEVGVGHPHAHGWPRSPGAPPRRRPSGRRDRGRWPARRRPVRGPGRRARSAAMRIASLNKAIASLRWPRRSWTKPMLLSG